MSICIYIRWFCKRSRQHRYNHTLTHTQWPKIGGKNQMIDSLMARSTMKWNVLTFQNCDNTYSPTQPSHPHTMTQCMKKVMHECLDILNAKGMHEVKRTGNLESMHQSGTWYWHRGVSCHFKSTSGPNFSSETSRQHRRPTQPTRSITHPQPTAISGAWYWP